MFKKIYIMYMTVIFISFFISSIVLGKVLENYFMTAKENQMLDNAQKIGRQYSLAYSLGVYDEAKLNYDVRVLRQHLDTAIWFVDSNGRIYIDRRDSNQYKGYEIEPKEIDKILNGQTITIRNKYISILGYPVVTIGYPIVAEGKVIGGLLLHSSIPEIQKTSGKITEITIILLVIMLLLILVVSYIFSNNITMPLKIMKEKALKYAKGDFAEKINVNTKDEIEDLADSLNTMADELKRVEENRRIFLSNISHDIKTPLTNINGFLEAMKDGTIEKENQDKYIQIILNETKRLINFTKEIISLNDVSKDEMVIKNEQFDINQLIKDTLSIFEGRTKSKNIMVDLTLAEKSTFVFADKEKIHRVLYNIIDNAIKFCYENKKIYIETTLNKSKVEVTIKDEGIGLSDENMNHIWNRFYKVDESRGSEKSNFGLGLYIVKQIMEAHGEEITVESVENDWTKFTFTLEKRG